MHCGQFTVHLTHCVRTDGILVKKQGKGQDKTDTGTHEKHLFNPIPKGLGLLLGKSIFHSFFTPLQSHNAPFQPIWNVSGPKVHRFNTQAV